VLIDLSARGKDFRFLKFSKQRKDTLPGEVLELEVNESEYLHFNVLGNTPDKETIGLMMDRHPVLISRKAGEYGVVLMKKPRGRKPKQKPETTPNEQ